MSRARSTGAVLLLVACESDPGQGAVEVTDVFQQAATNELDVLWVLSDASSMSGPREALAAGVEAFADQVDAAGIDLHAGVVGATFAYEDPTRGVLVGDPPVLTAADLREELPARFLADGSASPGEEERGLEASVFALSPAMTVAGGANEGFLRPEAALVVVYVSTRDSGPAGDLRTPPEELAASLWDLKPQNPDLVSAVAAVGALGSACAEAPGSAYTTVATVLGGALVDVCDLEADPSLGFPPASALEARPLLATFALSADPVPSTIEVTVDDVPVAEDGEQGWTFDAGEGAITLHGDAVPPRGSQGVITYTAR